MNGEVVETINLKCSLCENNNIDFASASHVISKKTGLVYDNFFLQKKAEREEGFIPEPLYICKACYHAEKGRLVRRLPQMVDSVQKLPITTASFFQNRQIVEYKGIVSAQTVIMPETLKNESSGKGLAGSAAFMDAFRKSRESLISEISREAAILNANAVIGFKMEFEDLCSHGAGACILLGTGTAVLIES